MRTSVYYFLFVVTTFFGCKQEGQNTKDFTIMAYYMPSDPAIDVSELPLDRLTHIIFSFTEVKENKMVFVNEKLSPVLEQLIEARKNHPRLKVMVACGGWGGSGGFSDMADTEEERATFVRSVKDFIKQYDIDGLDIDWEYPGLPGIGNPYKDEDKENFTSLMSDLRMGMDSVKPGMILSFAAAGWERFFDYIEVEKVMSVVDFINMMTYDFVGSGSPFTGHHTNLRGIELADLNDTPVKQFIDTSDTDYNPRAADNIIQFCINLGIDPKQIVIGGAFYGKAWKGVPPGNNGLYQTHGGFKGYHSYQDITQLLDNERGYIRYWDEMSAAPYLYHQADSVFVTYDDTMSMRLKTSYGLEQGLGGIMFWQLGSDSDEDGLVNSIYKEVNAR